MLCGNSHKANVVFKGWGKQRADIILATLTDAVSPLFVLRFSTRGSGWPLNIQIVIAESAVSHLH